MIYDIIYDMQRAGIAVPTVEQTAYKQSDCSNGMELR